MKILFSCNHSLKGMYRKQCIIPLRIQSMKSVFNIFKRGKSRRYYSNIHCNDALVCVVMAVVGIRIGGRGEGRSERILKVQVLAAGAIQKGVRRRSLERISKKSIIDPESKYLRMNFTFI